VSAAPSDIDWDTVAPYYDAYVRTSLDVPYFLDRAKESGGPVLELMCGTGRLTLPLAEAGHDVTGVDRSAALLARLRAKLGPRTAHVRLVLADVRSMSIGRTFPLVFVGFHSFAEILGSGARRRAMAAIRPHVAPGGRLILTLHNPPVRAANAHVAWRSMGTFPLDDGTGRSVEVSSRWRVDLARARVHGDQRYREIARSGEPGKESSVPITFDLVSVAEVRSLAMGAGLDVRSILGDYGGASFDPASSPFAIFELVAREHGQAPRAAH
jgi:SAM-dependent methyltransferase